MQGVIEIKILNKKIPRNFRGIFLLFKKDLENVSKTNLHSPGSTEPCVFAESICY